MLGGDCVEVGKAEVAGEEGAEEEGEEVLIVSCVVVLPESCSEEEEEEEEEERGRCRGSLDDCALCCCPAIKYF